MSRKKVPTAPSKKSPEELLVEKIISEIRVVQESWTKEQTEAFLTHCVDSIAKARLYVDSFEEQKSRPHMNLWALFSQVEGARAEAIGLLGYLAAEYGEEVRNGVWSLACTTRKIGRKTALHALTPPTDWSRFPTREINEAEVRAAAGMFAAPI